MATNWPAEALGAYNDIAEEGFAIVVRTEGVPGTFNPTTLKYEDAAEDTDYATYGIKKRFSVARLPSGTIVQANDYLLVFSAYGLPDLTTNSKIVVGGVELNVVTLGIVDPGNVRVLYEALIRD